MLDAALAGSAGKATYEGSCRECPACGGSVRFVGCRLRWVRTLCGDQRVSRAYYHCAGCHTGHLPWDEAAGLIERVFSPGAKALIAECCARLTHRGLMTGSGPVEAACKGLVNQRLKRTRMRLRSPFEKCTKNPPKSAPLYGHLGRRSPAKSAPLQ